MCGATCDPPPTTAPGESALGEAPFTRGLDRFFERLRDALESWRPVFDALSTAFGWLIAPFALLVWLTTPVALLLAYGLEGTYTAVSLVPAVPCTSMVLVAAIVLLVLFRLAMLPMQLRGRRSRARRRRLKPQERALQERYKDSRKTLQQELAKLYRDERANPFGGCLIVIVMVLLVAGAWRMLKGLTVKGPTGTFDPDFLHDGSNLRTDLTGVGRIDSWGMDLLASVGEVGWCTALIPYAAVQLVAVALTLAQTHSSLKEVKHLPNAKYALMLMMLMGVAAMFLLPMFLVILKIVDTAQMWVQNSYIKRRVELKPGRLREDHDFQRSVGENISDELLGRTERHQRPNPVDGDDMLPR